MRRDCRAAVGLRWFALLVATFAFSAAGGDRDVLRISLKIEPEQDLRALLVAEGGDPEEARALQVSKDEVLVPGNFKFPMVVTQKAFESVVYTESDLRAGKPLQLRKLARLHGRVVLPESTPADGVIVWYLQEGVEGKVERHETKLEDDGKFDIAVPARVYRGILAGEGFISRLRLGIVTAPGESTSLGHIPTSPTTTAAIRVIDKESGEPVPNAVIEWDPPSTLNQQAARDLLGERLSSRTDAAGKASINGIGPLPLAARWKISADGYAAEETAIVRLSSGQASDVPIVHLLRQPKLIISAILPTRPEDGAQLVGATIVLRSGKEFSRSEAVRLPLKRGRSSISLPDFGDYRIEVRDRSDKLVLYRDTEIAEPVSSVELIVAPVEIYGRVLASDEPVRGAWVAAVDPIQGSIRLGETFSGPGGSYSLVTWQRGKVSVSVVQRGGDGASSYPVSEQLMIDDRQERLLKDFDVAGKGARISVTDAVTGRPVRAIVDENIVIGSRRLSGTTPTDEHGVLILEGYPDGTGMFTVRANGYESQRVEVQFSESMSEIAVRLNPGAPVRGTVVDVRGFPVAGAFLSGGYPSFHAHDALYKAWTSSDGRFTFDSPIPPGMEIWVVAPAHALSVVRLASEEENRIVLHPPSEGLTYLRPDGTVPETVYMATVSRGGHPVPVTVLMGLAEANGLTTFQLFGTGHEGILALPRYLAPGVWDVILISRGDGGFEFRGVGEVRIPSAEPQSLFFRKN